jgi:hypothetical protein
MSSSLHFIVLLYALCAVLFTVLGLELSKTNRFIVKTVAFFCYMEALHNLLFSSHFIFKGLPQNGWWIFIYQLPILIGLIAIWFGILYSNRRQNEKESRTDNPDGS